MTNLSTQMYRVRFWQSGSSVTSGNKIETPPLNGIRQQSVHGYTWGRVSTPDSKVGWKSLIRSGVSATTDLVAHKVTTRMTRGYFVGHSSFVSSPSDRENNRLDGNFVGMDTASFDTSDDALRNKVLGRFLGKYQSEVATFQGGVFAGELRETIELITRPGHLLRDKFGSLETTIKKIVARAKHRYRGGLKQASKQIVRDASNEWLSWSFGVKPLVADVSDGATALAKLTLRPESSNISAHAESILSGTRSIIGTIALGTGFSADEIDYSRAAVSYRYYGSVWLAPNNLSRFLDNFGFAPENWLPTIWELIPYSFAIDYFTNIGEMISAASFGTSRLAWCNLTKRATSESHRWAELRPFVGGGTRTAPIFEVWASPTSTVKRSYVYRTAAPSLVMDFQFRFPGIGSTRWINLAALVAGKASLANRLSSF